jgi:hypothetical protein
MSHAPFPSADTSPPPSGRALTTTRRREPPALLVGLAIGSGIFRVPSTVAAQIGSVGGVAIIWLAGAAVTSPARCRSSR